MGGGPFGLTSILFNELLKNGVLIVPGLMLVTEIGAPSAINSRRNASIAPSTACFEALYELWSGRDTMLSTDDMAISAPCPVWRKCGNAASEPCTCPK